MIDEHGRAHDEHGRFVAGPTEIEDLTVIDAEVVGEEWPLQPADATAPTSAEVEVFNDAYQFDPYPMFTMTVIEESWGNVDKMADAIGICERIYPDLGRIVNRSIAFDWPEMPFS